MMLDRNHGCPFATMNAELKEENRQLRALLTPEITPKFPKAWKLNPTESRVLACLFSSPTRARTKRQIMAATIRTENQHSSVLATYVTGLRKKTGLTIENEVGVGYRLPPETAEAIRKALSDAR